MMRYDGSQVRNKRIFDLFSGSMGLRRSQVGFYEKSAKYAEKIIGLRTRYGYHKNAVVRPETARCPIMRGAAGTA